MPNSSNFSLVTQFYSIEEVPFDELFDGSIERMDAGTYEWVGDLTTVEDKKARIRQVVENVLSVPNFCYKVTLDGRVVVAVFGVRVEGDVYGTITLARPDANGSRSYIYRQDVRDDRHNLLIEGGITTFWGFMPPGSPLQAGVDERNEIPGGYLPIESPMHKTHRVFKHWVKPEENE